MKLTRLIFVWGRGVLNFRFRAAICSLATLMVGGVALLGADYGLPVWIQVPVYLWLLTLGLPTTLTVACLAAVWGRMEPCFGLGAFMAVCGLVAPAVHVLVQDRLRRWSSGDSREAAAVVGGPRP